MSQVTTRPSVSVVAVPLAVDRRALSQAWYDALHVAASPASVAGKRRDALVTSGPHASVRRANGGSCSTMPITSRASHIAEPGSAKSAGAAAERRAPRSELAAKIERKLVGQPSATHRLTFSAADGRVAIVLHGEGAKARIVAICAPHLREAVSRALVEARYHLAGRGITLETSVRERIAC